MTTTSTLPLIVPGVNTATETTKSKGDDQTKVSQDRFLTLLIQQMKSQDPLNPMDNAQMTTQLAQISTVDGVDKLNKTMEQLLGQLGVLDQLNANAMIGHSVLLPGDRIELSYDSDEGGIAAAGFNLPQNADSVKVQVQDANGTVVRTLNLGVTDKGMQTFRWDGQTDAGAMAPEGRYRFSVHAQANGEPVVPTALSVARVDGVQRSEGQTYLDIGGFGLKNQADVVAVY